MSKEVVVVKNTIIMFVRMIFVMLLTLISTRLLLATLGIEAYGLYDLIFGIVLLFNAFSTTITTALQRFFNVYFQNENKISQIYSISLFLFFFLSVLVFFLGFSFCNLIISWLSIPSTIVKDAEVFFLLCVLNLILNIIRMPYISYLIANERMGLYSFISIFDAVIKFLSIFILSFFSGLESILIVYGWVINITTLIVSLSYVLICYLKLQMPKIIIKFNREIVFEILGFSGWTIFGSSASLISQQGLSVLLNKFFGILINAANAVSQQIYTAVLQFVSSFQSAFSPYLMKAYTNENSNLENLIVVFTKISFFLYIFISLPLFIYMDDILSIWLVSVPSYAVLFGRITLIVIMFEVISTPLWIIIQATGNIKKYQLIVSFILLSSVFFALIFVSMDKNPENILLTKLLMAILLFSYRCYFVFKTFQFKLIEYIKRVVIPLVLILLFCTLVVFLESQLIGYLSGFVYIFLSIFCIEMILIMVSYLFLMDDMERDRLKSLMVFYLNRIKK